MNSMSQHFEAAVEAIPRTLLDRSGKAFYSGRNAFSSGSPLYILGANPGGTPESHVEETVRSHTQWVSAIAPKDWSAYRDESWKGKRPGHHGMQPRILHALSVLGLDPGSVPASNVVFVRSQRESSLDGDFESLAIQCWPLHEHVIRVVRPKVVLCLGITAGNFVRERLGAFSKTASFIEHNARRWQSHSYTGVGAAIVVVATHPSIADWRAPATDPTGLMVRAIYGS